MMHKALTLITLSLAGLVPAPAHVTPPAVHTPHLTANTAATELARGESIAVPPQVSDAWNARLASQGYDDVLEPVLRDVALATCASDADCELARTARAVI